MSKYEEGKRAEFVVAEMLKADGWRLASAPDLDEIAGYDGAPLIRGDDGSDIMPDIHAMKNGRTVWVEVKLKTTGAEYIKKNDQYEHFIDAPNWRDYVEVLRNSGNEVWLAIVEKPSNTLQRQLIEDIDVVGWWSEADIRRCDGQKYGERGVFVPQSDFLPTDIPAELASELSEQKQLDGTAEISDEILPDLSSDDSDEGAINDSQADFSEYLADGGETDGETEENDD
jgi:hypothetical protein